MLMKRSGLRKETGMGHDTDDPWLHANRRKRTFPHDFKLLALASFDGSRPFAALARALPLEHLRPLRNASHDQQNERGNDDAHSDVVEAVPAADLLLPIQGDTPG